MKTKTVKFHGPIGEIRTDVDINHYKEDGDELLMVLLDGKTVLARGSLSLTEIQSDKVNSKNIDMKTASILSGFTFCVVSFSLKTYSPNLRNLGRLFDESWRTQTRNLKNWREEI